MSNGKRFLSLTIYIQQDDAISLLQLILCRGENNLSQLKIKPRFLGCSACNLATGLTELSQNFIENGYMPHKHKSLIDKAFRL
jgi:hypothetical protein